MKKIYCPECDSEIVCTFIREHLHFYIDKEGKVKRDINPDIWYPDNYLFHCSKDKTHDLYEIIDSEWENKFIEEIKNINGGKKHI